MYNILVNNLSKMNYNAKVNTYSFQTRESKKQETAPRIVTGIYTNEPVTHIIIQELKEKQEKLDEIICLATETVREKDAIFIKNGNPVRDVTVDVLTKMIHELLEQIGMIR